MSQHNTKLSRYIPVIPYQQFSLRFDDDIGGWGMWDKQINGWHIMPAKGSSSVALADQLPQVLELRRQEKEVNNATTPN